MWPPGLRTLSESCTSHRHPSTSSVFFVSLMRRTGSTMQHPALVMLPSCVNNHISHQLVLANGANHMLLQSEGRVCGIESPPTRVLGPQLSITKFPPPFYESIKTANWSQTDQKRNTDCVQPPGGNPESLYFIFNLFFFKKSAVCGSHNLIFNSSRRFLSACLNSE